jgi:hypothetical protein
MSVSLPVFLLIHSPLFLPCLSHCSLSLSWIDPDTLAVEFVNSGIQGSQSIQVELYIQLLKQLTENPSGPSIARGWELMIYMLSCFPPPPPIENYVLMFIREHVSTSHSLLHSLTNRT